MLNRLKEKFVYQEEITRSLATLRRGFLYLMGLFLALGAGIYPFSNTLLRHLSYKPLHMKLVAFGVTEAFFALIKVTLLASLFVALPLLFWWGWRSFKPLLRLKGANTSSFVLWAAILLFYTGALFCYFVTLPFGIQFLLGYETAEVQPLLSVGRYVSFCSIFIFGFGLTFELPLILSMLSEMRIVNAAFLSRNRKYALLLSAVIAAVVTPTPDVVNMSLMGGPLYLLFEVGVLLVKIAERRRAVSSMEEQIGKPVN